MENKNSHYVSQLKELNQQMLVMAEKGEWTHLTEMEIQRRKLIDDLIKHAENSDSEVIAGCIKEAQDNHKAIKKLANEARDQVLQNLNEIRQRKSVSQAYNQNLPAK